MTPAACLAELGTATVGEVVATARIIDLPIRPLAPEMIVAGPALTVRCQPGDVLVVDYGGSTESGPFGEIMALACQVRGIAGMVIDGSVRDSRSIVATGFPVFCRGLNIRGTTKQHRGEIGGTIRLGSITIERGDMVIADNDAIVVLSPDEATVAVSAGRVRAEKEAQMMARLRGGETTLQILGLSEGDRK